MFPASQVRPAALILLLVFQCNGMLRAAEPLPLEVYGNLPTVSQMAISPSGERVALRSTTTDYDVVAVIDLATSRRVGAVSVDKIKPRDVYFASESKLILIASTTARRLYARGPWEASAAIVYDLETDDITQLLRNYKDLYPVQSGLGRIVGQSRDRSKVYMPAYIERGSSKPTYGLLEVDLDRGRARVVRGGKSETIDWFVDADGEPLAEEIHEQDRDLYQVYSYTSGRRTLIYEERTNYPSFRLDGVTRDRKSLLFAAYRNRSDYASYFTMDLADGTIVGPLFERDGASIEAPVMDINRVVYGVEYVGFRPAYRLIDDELDARLKNAQDRTRGAALSLVGWTDGFDKLLVYVSGAWSSGGWYLVSDGQAPFGGLANARPEITEGHMAPTSILEYEARDGLKVPALVTLQDAVREAGKAPLVVLPHGGPASFDRLEFDWLAQFLASRGNVVLQPQFRGSTGFGLSYELEGRGEWGRKMSTDLDDGVRHLVEQGLVDAERVCIVGASYGGYAALAAAAFSDFDYRCAVSIAGVSDLEEMLSYATRRSGRGHWVVDYWEDQFGAGRRDDELLEAISPVHFAESIEAPVLLVHGRDDTIVPPDQSDRMFKALRRAKKPVEYIKLRGEDHFLSESGTRLETLRAVEAFLKEHL